MYWIVCCDTLTGFVRRKISDGTELTNLVLMNDQLFFRMTEQWKHWFMFASFISSLCTCSVFVWHAFSKQNYITCHLLKTVPSFVSLFRLWIRASEWSSDTFTLFFDWRGSGSTWIKGKKNLLKQKLVNFSHFEWHTYRLLLQFVLQFCL